VNKFAVCEFNKDGTVFPVGWNMDNVDNADAQHTLSWMNIGFGQSQDWRIIPMKELHELMQAGKVTLSCFTPEAQREIMASAEAAP